MMIIFRFIIISIIIILPLNANATSASSTSSVTIVSPIALSEVQQLNFGKVVKPTSGNVNIRVNRDGTYNSATNTIGSFQKNGQIKIVGQPGTTVNVTEVSKNSTIPGVTFDLLLIPATPNLPNGGATPGQRIFTIGGRINLSSTATPGVYNSGQLSYTIDVSYQ